MNFDPINGRPCRIMWSQGDPSLRESGVGKVFIKKLDKSVDNRALYDTFSAFGNILSCNVAQAEDGTSKGYGFVHFDTEEAAEDAIAKVNGMLLNDKKVLVTKWMSHREWKEKLGNHPEKFTNVYIKNFGEDMDEERLKELAEKFGKVQSLKVETDKSGCSKGFGFVCYESPEDAQQAVVELHGREWNGQKLYAGRAQKKAERQMHLKSQFEKKKSECFSRCQGVILFVKNLDETIDDDRLREEFSACGTITRAKVMMDDKDNSKGFGFVCFLTPEEATKAVTAMNGRTLVSKPLYVALAQRKEERRAQLAAQRMQHIADLRMQQEAGQQVGQVFPQAGTFYTEPLAQGQVSLARGIRQEPPRGVPDQQPQPAGPGGASQRLGGTGQPPQVRGGPEGVQTQRQPLKFGQNVRNQPQRHPGAVATQSQDPVQQTIHVPEQEPFNFRELTVASPQEQKQIIGERLYPMVHSIHPDQADKITGMLLEIDNAELLHMLESREALAAKTREAVSILRTQSATENKSAEIEN